MLGGKITLSRLLPSSAMYMRCDNCGKVAVPIDWLYNQSESIVVCSQACAVSFDANPANRTVAR